MNRTRDTLMLFCFFAIIFIPASTFLFSFQEELTGWLFTPLIQFLAAKFFPAPSSHIHFTSDSVSLYLLLALLLFISILLSIGLSFSHHWRSNKQKLFAVARIAFCYYLAMQLLGYGADKIFKAQFYQPEPNILYTPFGYMEKDILYWSTMGTSYSYNFFLGMMEVMAALLLLFSKTRLAGLLIALALMVNIVAVNFSFDISVKLYASFLLFLIVVLLWPYMNPVYQFLINNKLSGSGRIQLLLLQDRPFLRSTLKIFFVSVIVFEAFHSYAFTGHINDDGIRRPYLHGAYQVLEDSSVKAAPFRRFFIHRDGYFITQSARDEMKDYRLSIDTIAGQLRLTDYNNETLSLNYTYSPADSILDIRYPASDSVQHLRAKALDWRKLPVNRRLFHWFVEEIK